MPRDLLRRVRSLSQLSDLFVHLGYQHADLPFAHGTRVIARWRSFRVAGIEADDPRAAARALARKLGADGERALAAVIGGRELAIAAPRLDSSASTRVLIVGLDDPIPLAIDQLLALRPKRSSTALAHMLAVVGALSTEVAGHRFFTEFRITLERMAGSLGRRACASDRRMVALLALTRVLFLYFIQAKGWLAGRRDYLRTMLDVTLGKRRPFHETALDPLFFGTLNRPLNARAKGCVIEGIPYLNGGLFERHPTECRIGPAHFSDELWRDAFERLFDRFRFCVREADEVDAIAPDMLGRVFERLMHPDERAQTGTFYTPEEVVREIVKETVVTALPGMSRLTAVEAEQLMAGEQLGGEQRREARTALERLRILDPAVGSGAFLLGALALLTEAARSLQSSHDRSDRWQIRRRILRENLFGVDLNPMAVRLAELRLWLAVVADDPTTDIACIQPLPNLDGIIRQGNTLLDPISTVRSLAPRFDPMTLRASEGVLVARESVFDARGQEASQALQTLRAAEQQLAEAALRRAAAATSNALDELAAVAAGRDLFGRRTGLSPLQSTSKRMLEHNRLALARAVSALRDGTIPFFSFEVHAPEVMNAGGFHVVVGNPPWVRAERLSLDERQVLRDRFSWWRGSARRGFAHLPDLALAFLQRALELAAPGGAIGFLLPSKVVSAEYGHAARHHLVRETTITYLQRVSDEDAARFGATTYPLAIVLRNRAPSPEHAVKLSIDGADSVRQASLPDSGPWVLVPDRIRDAVEQFRLSGPALRDAAPAALGVKTGADAVMTGVVTSGPGPVVRVQFGGVETDIERTVLRAAMRGRDVFAFDARPSRVVIWGYDRYGRPWPRLPQLAARHVEQHRERLLGRADYRGGMLWMLFRTRAALAVHRVVWRDIARRPCAVMLDCTTHSDALPLNSCYVAPFRERKTALAATAVLNSTWSAAFAAVTADEARGGYRRINARVVEAMPLAPLDEARSDLATLSLEAHRSRNVSQDDLDEAVAEALALPRTVQEHLRSVAARHR